MYQFDWDVFSAGGGSRGFLRVADFIAPLKTSIVPTRGVGPATFTRASVAYIVDWEGLLKSCVSGEARFYGARRVQNLVGVCSENNTTITTTDTTSSTSTVTTVSLNVADTARWYVSGGTLTLGKTYRCRAVIACATSRTVLVRAVSNAGGTAASVNLAVGPTPQIVSLIVTPSLAGVVMFGLDIRTAAGASDTTTGTFTFTMQQIEDVSGQSNQNPSEYQSVGVLAAPFQGANVDGVQYFTTQNGNTVASNVVTEATGPAIADATLRGFQREPAQAGQLVTPTASIRGMNDAAWVKTTMTAALTSTGADGLPTSATRLTATAGNATVIQTLVAAATSRTYSVWLRAVSVTGNIEITQDGATWTNVAPLLNTVTYTQVSLNATQLNASFGIRIVNNGNSVDADFNGFEAGAVGTSPIATAGGTRAADSLAYPGSNVNTATGTAYAEVRLPVGFDPANAARYVSTDTGNAGTPLIKAAAVATTGVGVFDGTLTATKTGLPDATAQIVKVASAWGGSSMSATGNGLAPASQTFDGGMGDGAIVTIGASGAGVNVIYGTIRNVKLWKRDGTTQIQAITAP